MKNEMLWIDIETTGLNANTDVPLEVGLALSDKEGNISATTQLLIWDEGWSAAVSLAKNNDIVGPMHTRSGLFNDLSLTAYTIPGADAELVNWLDHHQVAKLPLAGSSIGSLDRPFVIEWFPLLTKRISYRNIDVSSLKELCKMHNPELFEQLDKVVKKQEKHRVIPDIVDSVNEYRFYLDNFLFIP